MDKFKNRPSLLSSCVVLLASHPAQSADPPAARPHQGIAVLNARAPATFPHRIWAACDFERRTPDYGWFGPPESGPRMGRENGLFLRYFLVGGTEATFQHFSLTSENNWHILLVDEVVLFDAGQEP